METRPVTNPTNDDPDMTGLESKATGIPDLIIWLSREQPGRAPFIEITSVPRNRREDPHFDPTAAAICVLEPDFMVVRGDLSDTQIAQVRAWVRANEAMIEAFWEGSLPATVQAITQAVKRITLTADLAWN